MTEFQEDRIMWVVMKNFFLFLGVAMIAFTAIRASAQSSSERSEVTTVDSVDLNRYIGTWYEIARIPNPFQKQCVRNTTATYRLMKNGEIEVINKCEESDGSYNVAKGLAKVVDTKTDAKLKVSFVSILGVHLFWGDYWIIGLDKDYRYAVVGTPSRKYGWILCRSRSLTPQERQTIDDILTKQGYNPADFVPDDQTPPDSSAGQN